MKASVPGPRRSRHCVVQIPTAHWCASSSAGEPASDPRAAASRYFFATFVTTLRGSTTCVTARPELTDRVLESRERVGITGHSLKGGDPAAPSGTATLLRLHPPHRAHLRHLRPYGSASDFGCTRLGWCDGRCVQGPGTYSPRCADPRLLATPTSWRRVSASNPNRDRLFGIRSPSRVCSPLYRPM